MNIAQINRYIDLTNLKKEIKKQLEDLQKQLNVLSVQLIEEFEQDSVQSLNVSDHTVFLRRTLRASTYGKDIQKCIAFLDANGYNDIVKQAINANTLSAHVRELEDKGELDDAWKEAFKISEVYDLIVRG